MRSNFLPALVLAAFCFTLFRAMYLRGKSAPARTGIGVAAIILALPSLMFASNYALMVPFEDWFVEFHSFPGAEILAGLVGAILGVMFASDRLRPGKLNGPILIVCSVIAVSLLVTPFAKQLFGSVDYLSLKDKWSGDVCLQSSSHTCVPACMVTMARKSGSRITEPRLARAAGSTTIGTEIWYLKRALRKYGYELKTHNLRSIKDAEVPSQLGVTMGDIHHAVVLLGKDREGVVIGEPLRGRRRYTWKLFNDCYHPANWCITIEKDKR